MRPSTQLPSAPLFSASHAAAVGVDANALRAAVRQGKAHSVARGWYASGPVGTPVDEHRLAVVATVASFRGRVAAAGHSAAVLLRLPTYGFELDTVCIARLTGRHGGSRPGLTVTRSAGPVVRVLTDLATDAVTCVSPAVAVVQIGLVHGPRAALVAADGAVGSKQATPDDLLAAVGLFAGSPGILPIRTALRHVDARHESPGETLTRAVIRELGYRMTPQVAIRGRRGSYRVDGVLEAAPVVVEFDGAAKYGESADLVAEKRREDDLRELGYEVVRLTWADVHDHATVRGLLVAAIGRSSTRTSPSGRSA